MIYREGVYVMDRCYADDVLQEWGCCIASSATVPFPGHHGGNQRPKPHRTTKSTAQKHILVMEHRQPAFPVEDQEVKFASIISESSPPNKKKIKHI